MIVTEYNAPGDDIIFVKLSETGVWLENEKLHYSVYYGVE